ncbi:MAG TPA: cytochrome c biogenesis protein CcdA [Candidatus Dormibacteraeota bacterium]|jgi:cytochrome c-type biogenesis protein|nr:cytochrome c biogenesis protein CcdA [Candidatus Dormibacteraeota bacterium]
MVDLLALSLSAFSLGIVSGGSPCALPLVPGFIGYMSSQASNLGDRGRSLVGLIVILGVTTGMVGFASAATLFHTSLTGLITVATPVVIGILFLFGSLMIINHNPFYRIPQFTLPKMKSPLLTAFGYGGLYGVIALPCSSLVLLPFTIAITLSTVSALQAFIVFLIFGLGLGMPVVVVSMLSRAQGDWLVRQFASRARLMSLIGGAIMIGLAVYDLVILYPQLSLFL